MYTVLCSNTAENECKKKKVHNNPIYKTGSMGCLLFDDRKQLNIKFQTKRIYEHAAGDKFVTNELFVLLLLEALLRFLVALAAALWNNWLP